MTKVYPNASAAVSKHVAEKLKFSANTSDSFDSNSRGLGNENSGGVLTVWKKSLLFNCDGFTVFDGKGNLVFRVDNYCVATKGDITLMDPSGKSLLTIRRKRLSMSDNWSIYKGETTTNPILSVQKHVNLFNPRSLARATNVANETGYSSSSPSPSSSSSSKVALKADNKAKATYKVEGSYTRRCCTVYDENRKVVAEIRQKEATTRGVVFGLDVFRLILCPEIDPAIAMALVILLDQMFGSSKCLYFY